MQASTQKTHAPAHARNHPTRTCTLPSSEEYSCRSCRYVECSRNSPASASSEGYRFSRNHTPSSMASRMPAIVTSPPHLTTTRALVTTCRRRHRQAPKGQESVSRRRNGGRAIYRGKGGVIRSGKGKGGSRVAQTGKGQGTSGRGQRTRGKEQGERSKGQGARGKEQGARGEGQGAGDSGKGQMTTGEGRVANYTDNLAVDLLPFLRLNLDLAVDARDRPTLENLSDAGRIVQETVTTCAGASIAVPCRARPVPALTPEG